MKASKVKLTDAVVARAELPADRREVILWDTEVTGFGLRVRSTSKTYLVMYRPAGRGRSANAKKFKLGTPGTIATASGARQAARRIVGSVAAGQDPGAERAELKRKDRARLADLLDNYELYQTRRGYVGLQGTMSVLRRNLQRHLNVDVAELKGHHYVSIRNHITNKLGLPGAAENFWSRCRAFLSWCVAEKIIDDNPIFTHRKEKPTRQIKVDEEEPGRALSDEELIKVWIDADPETVFGRYVRHLILSGCRRTEAGKARRSMDAKDSRGRWIHAIPALSTKSGRIHHLPITKFHRELLLSCVPDARNPDLYFPSWKSGGLMSGWGSMLAALVKQCGVDFEFHDLRRTFRTGLSRLRVDEDIAEICISHSRKGLEKIYNRNTAPEEMRDAFELWAKHVQGLVDARRRRLRGTRKVAGVAPSVDPNMIVPEERPEWLFEDEPPLPEPATWSHSTTIPPSHDGHPT